MGYQLVETEPRVGKSRFRPDVLAYASSADGDLVPRLVVEVKEGRTKSAAALPALMKAHELLGTSEHYCVIDGVWYKADQSLRSLDRVDGPAEPPFGTSGFLTDVTLASALMTDRLWFEENKAKRSGGQTADFVPPESLFADTDLPGIETVSGDFIPVLPEVLWQARRRALSAFEGRGRLDGQFSTDLLIADAVALLVRRRLGGAVLDPCCGIGNFLWAAVDQASQLIGLTEFYGQDIDHGTARVARSIAVAAPLPTTIQTGNSLETDLPRADVVITAPPFGVRMSEPYGLLNGTMTREFELAVVDRCLRQLRPHGRAVFLLSAGVTFKQSAESYRTFLAHEFRIGALIGLPPVALSHTGIRTVLLVIDREAPQDAFVAQLGEDWRTQLTPEGGALTAVLRHLDDVEGD